MCIRFIYMDFAVTNVLSDLLHRGINRIVVSYDIACKYHIHFHDRITNPRWPLMTPTDRLKLQTIELLWLVPKFHLAAHIDGCADKFSFNWTKNVGRTCGEIVESNWAIMNGLATATREMGYGHRRDVIMDAMGFYNWRKATGEGKEVC